MPNKNEQNEASAETLFTAREIELLTTLKETQSLKLSAQRLKVSYRRVQQLKEQAQKKWKRAVNTNNYMLKMTNRDEGFKKLMLSVGRSTMQIEEGENTF